MYIYKAKLVRVIDGDTAVLNVDLGFRLWREDSFRLSGINAPEMKTETYDAGVAAKEYLCGLFTTPDVTIHTAKADKYGRWLATIYIGSICLNDEMVYANHAVRYMV